MLYEMLKATITIAAMSSLFSLIIVIVDAIVNNYGDVKIDINKGKKTLTVKGGAPLLSTLAAEGIFIPSSCGGRATCGVCKVKVTSDVGPFLPTEAPFINAVEQKSGIRLSCQVKAKSDVSIEIPESLLSVRRYKTKVISIKDLCYDTREIRLALKAPDQIEFAAGQFMQLVVPPYDKIKEETLRAYSISSPPSSKSEFEFIVRLVPEGIATTYIHTKLAVGHEIDIIGPMGDFGLHESEGTMVCISGGSGMAPFKSLLPDMKEKGVKRTGIWYFHGGNYLKDLYNLDFFRDLEKEWPGFHFVPVLFRPAPSDNWKGETGLVTDATLRAMRNGMEGKLGEAYLCGSPGMIDASIAVLKQAGVPETSIYYDKFS